MRVAVIGASGQLGTDVCHAFASAGDEVVPLGHAELEIASLDAVQEVFRTLKPDMVANTAAMHQVEKCELNPERAYAVNAIGPRNLALAAGELGFLLVHTSTDYVFSGSKKQPYEESDPPLPLNVYGNTKLGGEYFVRALAPRHFIVRTSAIYGRAPCRGKGGLNFVELMLKLARERDQLKVVNDEAVSPTSTAELAKQIVVLSRSPYYGLYHATAEGSCSWYEFAYEIFRITRTKVNLKVADPSDFSSKVPRPKYSVLENRRLKEVGLNVFRPWQEGLKSYLGASRTVVHSD